MGGSSNGMGGRDKSLFGEFLSGRMGTVFGLKNLTWLLARYPFGL
jgi:hypothetical protein